MACTARYEEEVVRLLYMFASIIIDHRYSPQNFLRQAAMQIPTLKLQALASTLFFYWSMSYLGWKCRCQALYSWSVSDSSEYVLFKGTPVTNVTATGQNMPCSALQLGFRNSAHHQSRENVNGFPSLCWQRQQQKLQLGRKQCKKLHAKIFHWRNHC